MQASSIKHLVLSGGGMLGISYLGLIKYLEENLQTSLQNNLLSITGCSAGAIIGSLIAIGSTYKELITIIKTMNFKDYININAESIINFMRVKGLESGKNLINFIKNFIKDKTDNENITFKEIKDKYNIELQIGVTNLSKSRFELMNSVNTPDVPIHKAISASIAIPFVFEPIVIGDDIFCDGGILNNLPIETIFEYKNEKSKDQKKDETKKDETKKDEIKTDEIKLDETKKDEIKTDEIKSDETSIEESILGCYLLNKIDSISKDNYQTIPLTNYMSSLLYTLSSEFINKKIQLNNIINNNDEKYKIIIFKIPCDIMTFLKIKSSHEDIDNIVNIAYNTSIEAFT
jgi:predicted patatin/cPLA2 family phospholipase